MKYLSGLFLLTLLILLSGCEVTITPTGVQTTTPTAISMGNNQAEPQWGTRTKTSGCQVNGPLQDQACTPGAIFPDATKEQICVPGYASSVRNVSTSLKNKVYASYGVKTRRPGQYEVDHLVSLQLGGSNDISNLWPEAAEPKPGFHEKDRVENWLHDQVCDGKMTLKDAQIKIATNWLAVYQTIPSQFNGSDSDDSG
ncbi:MAG: HNH endonuclease [Ktedonobacteraceae bacterium]|nr:HNH endonuclease [Ktedonobacteraceae bacterium]MBO0794312.1 HNH endonuclease [Ktedonobacteraceae bacterium]